MYSAQITGEETGSDNWANESLQRPAVEHSCSTPSILLFKQNCAQRRKTHVNNGVNMQWYIASASANQLDKCKLGGNPDLHFGESTDATNGHPAHRDYFTIECANT